MKITTLTALVALAGSASAHATPGEPSSLTLEFATGATTGAVMVSLFDSEAAYAGGAPVRQARLDVSKGERTAAFGGLKAGTYAVKAFHDVDGNGRMTTNPFGRPIEPFAFSNNARGNMGAATWQDARVAVAGATAQTIEIR